MKYTEVDCLTNEMKRHITCAPEQLPLHMMPDCFAVGGHIDRNQYYIREGAAVKREVPTQPDQPSYHDARRMAYPPVAQQLDAIWKAIAAMNIVLPQEAQSVYDSVLAVKAKFPKENDL